MQAPEWVVWGADQLPLAIKVFAPGDNLDNRGLNAVYNPERASAIVAQCTRADGTVPIDLAHGMTDHDGPTDRHEQYGEGKLRCDSTGVWLDNITWREDFKPKLLNRAWRFVSPTFHVDEEQMKQSEGKAADITGVITLSLTNIPATVDAQPIVRQNLNLSPPRKRVFKPSSLGTVVRIIHKLGPDKYRLYSGTGKNLGTFTTLAAAKKHEKQVNYFKSKSQS
jgi:hypothetical protein